MAETQDKIEKPRTPLTRVIACGALAHEILDICKQDNLQHIDLICLPAQLHLYPDQIPDRVREAIHTARSEGISDIYIAYADCGTGGLLDKVCKEENVERILGPHCYSFFMGNDAFEAESDDLMLAFFLTDFLTRHFENFVIKPLALDRHPELISDYFGNYEKLVYMAQINDPELDEKAQWAADFLGLTYERRFTGYGDLSKSLNRPTSK
jgi:hypothetical protein